MKKIPDPSWALIKEKDGEFSLLLVVGSDYKSDTTHSNIFSEEAAKDKDATYYEAYIEDQWSYPHPNEDCEWVEYTEYVDYEGGPREWCVKCNRLRSKHGS